jgi:hypothetical protein
LQQVRDLSPYHPRSNSVKRKQDDTISYPTITSNRQSALPIQLDEKTIEQVSVDISKVNSLVDKVGDTLATLQIDRTILGVFYDLKNAIQGIAQVQEKIIQGRCVQPPVTNQVPTQVNNTMVNLGTIPKRQRPLPSTSSITTPDPEPQSSTQVSAPGAAALPAPAPPTEEEKAKNKFREAVRVAECSTLILNLDMGKVPILNKSTIAKNATLALTTMAAKMEINNNTSIPCEDTVLAIDDILSITKNMEFYGKKTKTYTNNKDKLSGSYCTIPVKYEFESREEKIEAETILKEKCGASCSTPYPAILRECIKQVVSKVRKDYPNNQVRVSVDTKNISLRVSTREKSQTEHKNKWVSYADNIPLPREVLNVEARTVPPGFKLEVLPPTPGREKNQNAGKDTDTDTSSDMEG